MEMFLSKQTPPNLPLSGEEKNSLPVKVEERNPAQRERAGVGLLKLCEKAFWPKGIQGSSEASPVFSGISRIGHFCEQTKVTRRRQNKKNGIKKPLRHFVALLPYQGGKNQPKIYSPDRGSTPIYRREGVEKLFLYWIKKFLFLF